VSWVLLAINVGAFIAFAASGGGFDKANSEMLVAWGSNFGPLTAGGEWWRLFTAMFLHGGLVHLAVNMYTLYDVGRFTERLYGSFAFLVLYALSGLLGSAASVWWNPSVNSVGASGALFGVLGASLVFMLDRRNGFPMSVMKVHAISLSVFVVYGIANGLAQTNIDNAAHLGGLVGGVLVGFALSRPLGGAMTLSLGRVAAGIAVCMAAIVGLAVLTPNTRATYEAEKSFLADLKRFPQEEKALLSSLNEVLAKARQPGPLDPQLAARAGSVAGGWQQAQQRFQAYHIAPPSRLAPLHADMLEYVDVRRRAALAMQRALQNPADVKERVQEFNRLVKEGDAIVTRMNSRNAKK
jgi:rhomboid protease GluP